jgi:hypothetical protein
VTFVYDQLTETVTLPPDNYSAPYAREVTWKSPSGNYVFGGGYVNDTKYLVNTTYPPAKVWDTVFSTYDYTSLPLGEHFSSSFTAFAVDDEGSLWGQNSTDDGFLIELPIDTQVPVVRFYWTDFNSMAAGAGISRLFTFTMPDDTIELVVIPGSSAENSNPLIFHGTKGVGGELTKLDTGGTWFPRWAFQDDNGDIWIGGSPPLFAPKDTLTIWRITDVTGSSPYTDLQTFTLPEPDSSVADVQGHFDSGAFVGGWLGVGWSLAPCETLFRADLTDSTITTRDTSSDAVFFAGQQSNANPNHWYVFKLSETIITGGSFYTRAWQEIDPSDLSDGAHYDFDQWEVDTPDDDGSMGYHYLDNRQGFVGWRIRSETEEEQTADLFIYYFGEDSGEGGGDNDSPLIRVWGYSLDGHDMAVFRLGQSETLVYDLTTKQWAWWANAGRTNWRVHCGQNWIGMSTATLERAFGSDVVAGDDTEGILWILDPTAGLDDLTTTGNEVFTRTVLGGVPLDGRQVGQCNALTITLSLGQPVGDEASIQLRTSDDLGHNWLSHGSNTIISADYSAVVEWRSLGLMRQPGRLFEISDNGAAVRIGRADLR